MSAQAKSSFDKRVIRKAIPLADSRESHTFFRNRKTLDVPAYLCGCVKTSGEQNSLARAAKFAQKQIRVMPWV